MRIMVKGGVWKNTEDEILKAAVMKYGKNQWARISSLLVRKSPKLCKARWYEWLDPSIKKTEWSREEEEKLLHLAKLMPTQWRTIAPIVGRTASQCLEHYNKLLDAAQEKDESYDPADDPRRLRPGEIDPNPEAKPARPDPVDMDEDEKEMLSEARARLANTKGKKAKRKAREKQLEEARRLAALQKRRELKAAGIDVAERKRKIKGIDYTKEIPFQRKAPAGFYEVGEEERRPADDPSFVSVNLDRLEGKRKSDEESRAQRMDSKRAKIKESKNMPAAIMQINKLNDPEQVRKRSKLSLPSPQITDEELEAIAKMEESGMIAEEGSGSAATKTLLSNYAATPMQTPGLRTPMRTPAKVDTVLMEAQNLVALTNAQTPLKGGENTPLHPSDFSGATPRPSNIQTPNVLATPLRTPLRTPSGAGGMMAPPDATPRRGIRDQLNINEEGAGMELQAEKRRQNEYKKSLQKGLLSLPAPKNEYQIAVPQETPELEDNEERVEEDATDVMARENKKQQEREQLRLRERSTVIQRNLPRPLAVPKYRPPAEGPAMGDAMAQAEELVRAEFEAILIHDAELFPLGPNMQPVAFPDWDSFTDDELHEARSLVEAEPRQNEDGTRLDLDSIDKEALEESWLEAYNDILYVPALKKFIRASRSQKPQVVAGLQAKFDLLLNQMKKEAGKAAKLEKKLTVYNGGYMSRSDNLLTQIANTYGQLEQSVTEANCFRALREIELTAIKSRIEKLTNEADEQVAREARLQTRYANLMIEKEELTQKLNAPRVQT